MTAAVCLSVVTEKLRLTLRMAWPMFLIYTSMVTYINISSFLILSMYVRCSSLILSSLMAFVCTFRVCHARDLAWELVNGDDGGGPPVGLYGKVASKTKDSVAHVPFMYLKYTYMTTYRTIITKLIGWVPSPPARGSNMDHES